MSFAYRRGLRGKSSDPIGLIISSRRKSTKRRKHRTSIESAAFAVQQAKTRLIASTQRRLPREKIKFADRRRQPHGILGRSLAHSDWRVAGSSVPPDLPPRVAARAELLARCGGQARAHLERSCISSCPWPIKKVFFMEGKILETAKSAKVSQIAKNPDRKELQIVG